MSNTRITCVLCQDAEVHLYELACPQCRPELESLGLLAPATSEPAQPQRLQIGPLDI